MQGYQNIGLKLPARDGAKYEFVTKPQEPHVCSRPDLPSYIMNNFQDSKNIYVSDINGDNLALTNENAELIGQQIKDAQWFQNKDNLNEYYAKVKYKDLGKCYIKKTKTITLGRPKALLLFDFDHTLIATHSKGYPLKFYNQGTFAINELNLKKMNEEFNSFMKKKVNVIILTRCVDTEIQGFFEKILKENKVSFKTILNPRLPSSEDTTTVTIIAPDINTYRNGDDVFFANWKREKAQEIINAYPSIPTLFVDDTEINVEEMKKIQSIRSETVNRGDYNQTFEIANDFLNKMNKKGWTALHYALHAKNADPSIIESFINESKNSLNKLSDSGDSPLSIALKNNTLPISVFKLLLEKGANVVHLSGHHSYIFETFLNDNPIEITKLLIDNGSVLTKRDVELLKEADLHFTYDELKLVKCMKKIGKKSKILDKYREIFVKLHKIDDRLINQFIDTYKKRLIFYNGIGSNKSYMHTVNEFLNIIKFLRVYTSIFNENKDYDKFTLDEWMKEVGATNTY